MADKAEVRAKYLRTLGIQWVMAILLVGFLAMNEGYDGKPSMEALTIGLVVGFGVTIFNWKCPSCRAFLSNALYHEGCSSCGTSFSGK